MNTTTQSKEHAMNRFSQAIVGAVAAAVLVGGVGLATTAAPDTTTVAGRTNIHSDGRAAGKAMPRVGKPIGRGIGGHAIHKV